MPHTCDLPQQPLPAGLHLLGLGAVCTAGLALQVMAVQPKPCPQTCSARLAAEGSAGPSALAVSAHSTRNLQLSKLLPGLWQVPSRRRGIMRSLQETQVACSHCPCWKPLQYRYTAAWHHSQCISGPLEAQKHSKAALADMVCPSLRLICMPESCFEDQCRIASQRCCSGPKLSPIAKCCGLNCQQPSSQIWSTSLTSLSVSLCGRIVRIHVLQHGIQMSLVSSICALRSHSLVISPASTSTEAISSTA